MTHLIITRNLKWGPVFVRKTQRKNSEKSTTFLWPAWGCLFVHAVAERWCRAFFWSSSVPLGIFSNIGIGWLKAEHKTSRKLRRSAKKLYYIFTIRQYTTIYTSCHIFACKVIVFADSKCDIYHSKKRKYEIFLYFYFYKDILDKISTTITKKWK